MAIKVIYTDNGDGFGTTIRFETDLTEDLGSALFVETSDFDDNQAECLLKKVQLSDSSFVDDDDKLLTQVRENRDITLAATDLIASLPDFPIDAGQRTELETYRQALRDLPSTIDVSSPVYPTPPAWL